MAKSLSDYKALSFDCYGTLIDWETGLWRAVEGWFARHGATVDRDRLLQTYGRLESEAEHADPEALYADILVRVHKGLCEAFGVPVSAGQDRRFAASIADWPPFPDTREALQALKRRYRLIILSNVDKASFAGTRKQLGVDFDAVLTAEEIGSYKPDLANFRYLIARVGEMGIDQGDLLHCAQSLFHDHRPAKEMGLATAWIDRRHDQGGGGATPAVALASDPDFTFTSMAALAQACLAAP